jgi:hypothetical protein
MYTLVLEHFVRFVRRKVCICGLAEVLGPLATKEIGSANRKHEKCHNCGKSANITNYFSPQICGFAISGTYLRTAHHVQPF